MTEYELGDLINGVSSNIIAGQAVFITILSAYLVVAYAKGRELTKYQVSFVNLIFVLFMLLGIQAQLAQMTMAYNYADALNQVRGGESPFEDTKEVVRFVFIGIRGLIAVGALIFMWQVRHPKLN